MSGKNPAAAAARDLLSVEAVTKYYPGTRALNTVSFSVRAGEIHALAGQNGAGKSTLIRLLAGVEEPNSGALRFRGEKIEAHDRRLPISFIHQDLGLFETLTIAENIALSVGYARRGGLIDWGELERRTKEALAFVECDIDPQRLVSELSIAERSVVALARAMILEVDLIVLDEPTAALPAHDVEILFRVLGRLRDAGVSALYVTHRLDEIFALCDRVTVLRDGEVVASEPTAELSRAKLVELIAGRPIAQLFPTHDEPKPEVTVALRDVVVEHFGPISFEAHAGEIVALVGLRGAGHEAFGRAIFGALPYTSGSISLMGAERAPTVAAAIRRGIGFASGRRAQESLALSLSVRENLFLNPAWVGTRSLSFRSTEHRLAHDLVAAHGVWPPDPERQAATLSGGNQQKVVFARWAQVRCRVLILEEPTAGVDIGARVELYRTISDLCSEGCTCLVVSSDFDEVAGIAHRALVFDRGRIARQLAGPDLTAQQISRHASSGVEV